MSGGDLQPQAIVGEVYRLRRLLAEGSMGFLWEASHIETGDPYALKVLKGDKQDDRRRFQREVRAATAVRHPNVVTVHELVALPDGTPVIVMELLEGETLGAVIARTRRLSLGDLAAVLLPVLSALEAAHALGIVHRDLKPENIFLARTGVKVLDFGLAKVTVGTDGLAMSALALTATGSMVGTPYYMSPEQVLAEKDLDTRSDIWSLGAVIYECLAGVRPSEAANIAHVLKRIVTADFEPIGKVCPGLPDDVVAIVTRMLAPDREGRPGDLSDLRDVLQRHASAELPTFPAAAVVEPAPEPVSPARTPARPETLAGTARAPARATTRVIAAASVTLVALVIGAGIVRDRGREEPGVTSASTAQRPSASAEPAPSAPPPPAPSVSAPAPASAAAPSAAAAAASAAPVAPVAPVAAPVFPSATPCGPGLVLSAGHCCPRGHVWKGGVCERSLATSF